MLGLSPLWCGTCWAQTLCLIEFYYFTCESCSPANKAQPSYSLIMITGRGPYHKVIFSDTHVVMRLRVLRMVSSLTSFLLSVCPDPASLSWSPNHSLCIDLGSHLTPWRAPVWVDTIIFTPKARNLHKKRKKSHRYPTVAFSEVATFFANIRFQSQGPLNSQPASLFKQSRESFPDPKLLPSINCPSGFMATLFHIH